MATVNPRFLPAGPDSVAWSDIDGKPAVIAAGENAEAARAAIGAGTGSSNLQIGTTGTTAKAGDYQPAWTQVSNKPAVIAAGADAAAARSAIEAAAASDLASKADASALASKADSSALASLELRVAALETA